MCLQRLLTCCSKSPEVVWVGTNNLSDKSQGVIIPIEVNHVHPLYSVSSHYHDIALIKMTKPVTREDALPACLYGTMDEEPFALKVLGWGGITQGKQPVPRN